MLHCFLSWLLMVFMTAALPVALVHAKMLDIIRKKMVVDWYNGAELPLNIMVRSKEVSLLVVFFYRLFLIVIV